jgi:hypothetical protein
MHDGSAVFGHQKVYGSRTPTSKFGASGVSPIRIDSSIVKCLSATSFRQEFSVEAIDSLPDALCQPWPGA